MLDLLTKPQEFPGGLVVRTPLFHCQGPGFSAWLGSQDPTSLTGWPKKKKNKGPNRQLLLVLFPMGSPRVSAETSLTGRSGWAPGVLVSRADAMVLCHRHRPHLDPEVSAGLWDHSVSWLTACRIHVRGTKTFLLPMCKQATPFTNQSPSQPSVSHAAVGGWASSPFPHFY